MKKTIVLLALAGLLAGCQHAGSASNAKAHPEIGSKAWYAWVDEAAGVSDGQGHGPDYGSPEWCRAAHWRVFGVRDDGGENCSPAWQQSVDKALRIAGH